MNFIVVGCGRVGAELAHRLFKAGHQIVVVDSNRDSFNRLPPDFRGRTLEGEGLAEDVLERAGIKEAHGLAAVTNSDTLNAVVAHTARAVYGIANVVARNYDPALRSLIEAFGLQTVSSTYWGAQRVEELLTNPHMGMYPAAFVGRKGTAGSTDRVGVRRADELHGDLQALGSLDCHTLHKHVGAYRFGCAP